jgi:hypothetical protein
MSFCPSHLCWHAFDEPSASVLGSVRRSRGKKCLATRRAASVGRRTPRLAAEWKVDFTNGIL